MAAITVYRTGVFLAAALALSGCGGKNWPDLSKVQRPAGSDQPADMGTPAPPPPAPPAAPATAEVEARLKALDARVDSADKAVATAYASYLTRLDQLLASPATEDSLTSHWNTAQTALSRVGVAVDGLREARDAVAQYGLDLSKNATAPAGVAEAVTSAADHHAARRHLLDLETNRLAVLTPAFFGTPGPAAVYDSTRTALATISFATKAPAMAGELGSVIGALRKAVPDVAFDLIASGPNGTTARQQDALRAVMAELRRLQVPASQMALALAAGGAADPAVTVRIYVKKTAE